MHLHCTVRLAERLPIVTHLPTRTTGSRWPEIARRARKRLKDNAGKLTRRLEGGLVQEREARRPRTVVVRKGDRFDFISVVLVDWFEAANKYSVLHCASGGYVLSETLTSFEAPLEPGNFLRLHRSVIVNSDQIVGAYSMPGGAYELELRGGTRISTGRQYQERIRNPLRGQRRHFGRSSTMMS